MDRNSILGLVIIFGILIGFSYLNRPSKEQVDAARKRSDSLALVRAEEQRLIEAQNAAQLNQQTNTEDQEDETIRLQAGAFAPSLTGEKQLITLENDLISLKISTQGGHIHSAELKNYQTYTGQPLILFGDEQNRFGLEFWGNNNHIQTQSLFFTPSTQETQISVTGSEPYTLTMRLNAGPDSYIDYRYTLSASSYMVDFSIHFSGMNSIISSRVGSIDLNWDVLMPQLEKGAKNESNYTTIAYRFPNEEYEELKATNESSSQDIKTKLQWVGYKHQFFTTFLVAKESFLNANMESTTILNGIHTKRLSSRLSLPFENGINETLNLQFFFAPNHFNTLKEFEYGFENVIPLGSWIIKWINRYVIIFIFNILDNHITNYGLIIFLLTIIIKVVLFPLTYRSYVSQAKMRVLKPQVDELSTKFPKKEDAMKKQQAVMALYKKVGVNPLGGCLPMLIQFPILIAMFRFFPASFELRQKSFLWAEDLSSYDSILDLPFTIPFYGDHVSLFTLLMAAALYFTTKTSVSQMGDTNAQIPGMKFMMLYVMPIMLVFWFNGYSSGLSYYYFLSNVITLGQTYLIRLSVDDDAILKKLNENAKKPVKKSSFQDKLMKMAKEQQSKGRAKQTGR